MRIWHVASGTTVQRLFGTLGILIAVVAGVVRANLSMPVRRPALRSARCDRSGGPYPRGGMG